MAGLAAIVWMILWLRLVCRIVSVLMLVHGRAYIVWSSVIGWLVLSIVVWKLLT